MHTGIGLLGCGSLGNKIANSLLHDAVPACRLVAVMDTAKERVAAQLGAPGTRLYTDNFDDVVYRSDIIVEALPPEVAADYIMPVLRHGKTLILLSASVLVQYPAIYEGLQYAPGKLIVPSGSVAGLDAVKAMAHHGIDHAKISTFKPPQALKGAAYIRDNAISLDNLNEARQIFAGTVYEGAGHFPANINVAAALSLAGIGPARTQMEIRADPGLRNNIHRIEVEGPTGSIQTETRNYPDPANPKSSQLAAYSVLAKLQELG